MAQVFLWKDKWLGPVALKHEFSNLYKMASNQESYFYIWQIISLKIKKAEPVYKSQEIYQREENLQKKMVLYERHLIFYTTRDLMGAPKVNKG